MNSANRSATKNPDAPLLPLIGDPRVHHTAAGAAHIELEFTGGRKLLIVLDNETRQTLAFNLQYKRP